MKIIACVLIASFVPCSAIAAQNVTGLGEKPGIYIKREGQNKSALRMLKTQRKLCETDKQTLIQGRAEHPELWPEILAGLKRDRPQYNVDAALASEPNWRKVLVETEQEYFQGDLYAKYTDSPDYQLIDDGTCRIEQKPRRLAEIDTGKFRYDLDLVNNTGEKFLSPVAMRKQSDARMAAAMKRNPMLAKMMGQTAQQMGLPEAAEKLDDLTKVTGQDQVAGQACEYVGPMAGTKLCYWKTMHEYPTIMQRALVLKSVVTLGKDENVSEAIEFKRSTGFDPKVFSVPKGVKIDSQL